MTLNARATKAEAGAAAVAALLALLQWPEGVPNHLTEVDDLAQWLAGDAT